MKDWHFVPAVAGEFAIASGSFPIVFLGDRKLPVIVMGLRAGNNVFVQADGQFDGDHYVPAYVRRYPFVSANNPGQDNATVCVDVDAEFVTSDSPEVPFFDESGEPTDYTKQAIEYVSAFDNDARITEAFVQRVLDLDLLEKKDVKVANPNDPENPVTVADYWGVSQEKLSALPADKLEEMNKNGDLGAIYAHMISLQRWERVLRRVSQLAQAEQASA
ncbi:MAG: SapC family protein [Alphaproteobacteria bacterium]|nr:SapC family protein [Alphaproteobacteria bacterium]